MYNWKGWRHVRPCQSLPPPNALRTRRMELATEATMVMAGRSWSYSLPLPNSSLYCHCLLPAPLQFITHELNAAAQNVLCTVKMLQASSGRGTACGVCF